MKPGDASRSVLLCDFDETIVTIDTGEFALEHFGDANWRRIEAEYESGAITFEDSLQKEFGTIRAPEGEILKELGRVVVFRPNFDALVEYCRTKNIPFTVVSGGLDFCIRHFLSQKDWMNFIEICAPSTEYIDRGYRLTFPTPLDKESVNFKHDLVRYHVGRGSKVFYIGDGLGDYPAAKEADFRFAVTGSKLSLACRNGNVACEEITDFREVIEALERLLA